MFQLQKTYMSVSVFVKHVEQKIQLRVIQISKKLVEPFLDALDLLGSKHHYLRLKSTQSEFESLGILQRDSLLHRLLVKQVDVPFECFLIDIESFVYLSKSLAFPQRRSTNNGANVTALRLSYLRYVMSYKEFGEHRILVYLFIEASAYFIDNFLAADLVEELDDDPARIFRFVSVFEQQVFPLVNFDSAV